MGKRFSLGFLFVLVVIGFLGSVSAANFPLEIINIKPAGESGPYGGPAIPETNRIFRAYPGIEYNIRAAVIGGLYPYNFSLSNAPSGMVINETSGEISWVPDSVEDDASNIQLSVTDSEGTTISTSWSINVTKDSFIFVDKSYTEEDSDGSFERPYGSMLEFLNNTFDTGQETDIVYFRGGEYQIEDWNSASDNRNMNILNNPCFWIGYPGEDVDMVGVNPGENHSEALFIYNAGASANPFYFDGIDFRGFSQYGMMFRSGLNYNTIRRCIFSDLEPIDDVNRNQGFLYTPHGGTGYYLTLQDNEFKDWYGSSAIGSLYYTYNVLIEDNYIHSPKNMKEPGGIGVTLGLTPKSNTNFLTIRKNKIYMDIGTPLGSSVNSAMFNSDNVEIYYNFFKKVDLGSVILFNTHGHTDSGPLRKMNFYRNTVDGDTADIRFNPCENYGGPFSFYNNIFVLNNNQLDINNCDSINYTNNLEGTDSDNIINPLTGKLTQEYSEYRGTHGWEVVRDSESNNESEENNQKNILFYDGFESENLSSTNEDGFSWGNSNRVSLVRGGPGENEVTYRSSGSTEDIIVHDDRNWTAKNGDISMRFRYPSGNEMAEQRFKLGKHYKDIWFSYWIRVPTNFEQGSRNNKFLSLWIGADGYDDYGTVTWQTRPDTEGAKIFYQDGGVNRGEIGGTHFIRTPDDGGRWMKVAVYVKSASGPEAEDGIIQFYRKWYNESDWTVIHNDTSADTWNENQEIQGISHGYLMGWANDPYDEQTEWLVDDFTVSNTSLLDMNSSQTLPQEYHPADNNPQDGMVSFTEIENYMNRWLNGEITINELLDGVNEWRGF